MGIFFCAGSRVGCCDDGAQGVKAGVGLLTVGIRVFTCIFCGFFEAMWVPLPETPNGCLALEGLGKIRQFLDRATALAAGPGLGLEKETHSLVREVCNLFDGPTLLDADALRPEIFEKLKNPQNVVITPHAGEFERLAAGTDPKEWIRENPCTLVLKGSHSQILKGNKKCIA